MQALLALPALAFALVLLAGCGGTVQESLGLGKRVPDEFLVAPNAPLTMPPAGTRLPRPGEATAVSQARNPEAGARAALLGAAPDAAQSDAEAALLGTAPGRIDPNVRRELSAEAGRQETAPGAANTLFTLPFQRGGTGAGGETIDAAAEARRLRDLGIAAPAPNT